MNLNFFSGKSNAEQGEASVGIRGGIFRASIMLAAFSFAADLVALLRDRILASHFGASRSLDIYYSAFKIPDFIFNLLVLGAVSSAFIPVFLEHYRNDREEAWRLGQRFFTFAFTGILICSGVLFVFMGQLASIIAPGITGADRQVLVGLTRLMLISPIIFSISTIVGSILQSLERFLSYAIAPILYNLGIVIGALYLAPFAVSNGLPEVFGLGFGVILGALMHLLIQLPAVIRAGFRFKLVFDFADKGLRKILRLMIPRTIGLAAFNIDTIVSTAIASTMPAGSIAIITLANNLQFVPIAVVGVSVATAVFPKLSLHASAQELDEFKKKLSTSLKVTALLVTAGAAVAFVFRNFIINTLFGVGLFAGAGAEATASVLGIFMFGVTAQSLIPIMSRAFYAFQNTKIPVLISITAITTDIALAMLFSFVFHWGPQGIAAAFSIAGNLNFLLLYLTFRKKYYKIV